MDLKFGLTTIEGANITEDIIVDFSPFNTITASLQSLESGLSNKGQILQRASNGKYAPISDLTSVHAGTQDIGGVLLQDVAYDASTPVGVIAVSGQFKGAKLNPALNAGSYNNGNIISRTTVTP